MQLVRTHEVLGLLRDLAVARRRQQLRRDRRVKHVVEHGGKVGPRLASRARSRKPRFSACRGLVRHVAHEVPHERLGHAGVHAVHAHVVGVVGCPAQRKLGEVARAHHEAALPVRDVHEDLRALAGLRVLVGHGVVGLVVPDVGKVLAHGRRDGDLSQLTAERLAHGTGVVMRAHGRAKAGHRDGEDARAVKSQQVKRPRAHEQGKRGVKAARDAHDRAARVRVGKPLGQAVRLDGKDLLAALGAARAVGRHEGVRVDETPGKARLGHAEREGHDGKAVVVRAGECLERRHATAVRREELHIDDSGSAHRRVALAHPGQTGVGERLGLGQHAAVLAHEVVPAKDEVLR